MSDHIFEQEQVERIKKFLRTYGKAILIGLAIGLILILAYGFYHEKEIANAAQASSAYEKLLRHVAKNDREALVKDGQALVKTYANTPYALQAAMILARQAIYDGDYAEAIERLEWVMKHAKLSAMKQSARLRLARVYLAKQDYKQALEVIAIVDDPAYKMAMYEVKGDVLLAQGDHKAARDAYREALDELSHADFSYPLLQMKYDDLNGSDNVIKKGQQ